MIIKILRDLYNVNSAGISRNHPSLVSVSSRSDFNSRDRKINLEMASCKAIQIFLLALTTTVLLGNAAEMEISTSTVVPPDGMGGKPCESLAESPCKLDELSDLCKAYKERCDKPGLPSEINSSSTTEPTKSPSKLKKPSGKPQKPGNKPQKPGGKPQKPGGKPQKPGGKPQKPGGKPQKPSGKPQKPNGKPQKPSGKPQKPSGKPQKPSGKPQKPIGKPQKPAGKPQKPGGRPQKPSHDKPYGCVGSAQSCNCDCCPGLYCLEGAVPGTGRTCMKQDTPPGECRKERPQTGAPGLESGGGQLSQGAGSIPVVGPNLQQGAAQGTGAAVQGGQGQPPPVPGVG